MAGLYPDNQSITIFGEDVVWPGLDPETGKFTNGSFTDPLVKPSFIPADTLNLILDNLAGLITALGGTPDNSSVTQVAAAIQAALALKAPLASPVLTGTPKVPNKTGAAGSDGTLIATEAQVALKANIASPALTGTPTAPTPAWQDYSIRIATTEWVRANLQPVGTFYVQYPVAASNDYGTAFPAGQRPGALFGGTWTTMWDADRIFFRTGGASGAEAERSDGYQDDGIRRIYGAINNIVSAGGSAGTGSLYVSDAVSASIYNGGTGYFGTIGIDTNRQGVKFNSSDVRPKNRQFIIWQKIAL
jgi:hypothetical protein